MNQEMISKELSTLLSYMEMLINDGLPSLTLTPEYLIIAIMEKKDSMAYQLLYNLVELETLVKIHHAFYESASRKSLKAVRPNTNPKYNEALESIFTIAQEQELPHLGGDKLNSLHVLLGLLNESNNEAIIRNVFAKAGATYEAVFNDAEGIMNDLRDFDGYDNLMNTTETIDENGDYVSAGFVVTDGEGNEVDINSLPLKARNAIKKMQEKMTKMAEGGGNKEGKSTLESICTNLNDMVKKGKIDPLIGRETELKKIINVLGRKKKNNVVIVGDDGVGKTALCEGIASMIVHGEAPQLLANKTIWSLNLASLLAGTQFRGILEGRMQSLIDELKERKNCILYIDDIVSAFADKKNSDVDFASVFNSALVDGDIQVIGTCGFKGYRNTFDANPSLARKFQKIIIEETTEDETVTILQNLKPIYEKYHNVEYDDEAIRLCIQLAKKYIPERHLPDSAIDVFDECGAEQSIIHNDNEITYSTRKSIYNTEQEIEKLKKDEDFDGAEVKEEELKKLQADLSRETRKIQENDDKTHITTDMVYNLVSRKTGIPIQKLSKDEKKNIASINDTLKESIIGQDEAVDAVCKAIKRNRVGLGRRKTMGTFLMAGKTGVGKSLLAKTLAKEIFGSEKYLVRIDMSEYEDKTSVNKLIGSSAGYIGYENGGVLTEAIKNKKYCVLLLDEFEKASPEVYNLFLQVFDEGFLSDNTGQRIDFKNIIVILTSNVGAKSASDFGKGVGFDNEDKSKQVFEKELKRKFSPEFLNRLDDIIYFNTLSEDNMHTIIRLELKKLNERLKAIGYSMEYEDNVVEYIYSNIDEKEYGARPILRIIQDKIENPITDLLLINEFDNHIFKITCSSENELTIV